MQTDIVVVGAGVAGLASATAIRRAGRRCVLLEASSRIGGRAYTSLPPVLAGAAFDHGASWLHAAERNPLVPIARAAGDQLISTDATWTRHVTMEGRAATPDELAAYEQAETRFETLVDQAAAGPDCSMAEAVAPMQADPWLATIETFEATLIAAADSRALSVQDAHLNALNGTNLAVPGGVGAFVTRRLGTPDVTLDTPVTAIEWRGDDIVIETTGGTLQAAACIVTVSTGVLRAGAIRFTPTLPASHTRALDGLPMGVLTKVALAFPRGERLGLPTQCSLHGRVQPRHAAAMFLVAWPQGAAHMIGFVGGSAAAALSENGGAEEFARAQIGELLGAHATAAITGTVLADWARDPWFRGAYAYATPGQAGARAALGMPLAGGRLILAGEATETSGLAGTVGGAYASGTRAAALALAALE